MSIRVFIVDDHHMVIEGIRFLLQGETSVECLGHATSAASCLAFLSVSQPDIILMDINLPDTSGIELCRVIKLRYPSLQVIGLSTFNQQSFVERMIQNGASGYILKNATREELVTAIHRVNKGKKYYSAEIAQSLKSGQPGIPLLTRREKEVLELIAEGYTNAEIADKIYVSVTTVDTHRKNLLAKFDTRNTASLIRMAMNCGLL